MNFIAVVSIVELASIRAHNFELACRDPCVSGTVPRTGDRNGDRKHGCGNVFTVQLCQDMVPDVSTAKGFI